MPKHGMTVRRLIDDLLRWHWEDELIMGHFWIEDDIQEQAFDTIGRKLTRDEADAVLYEMDRKCDSSMGITWETVIYSIEKVVKDEREEVGS